MGGFETDGPFFLFLMYKYIRSMRILIQLNHLQFEEYHIAGKCNDTAT